MNERNNLKISPVAELISMSIDNSRKRQIEIAQEVGYTNPNVITMIKQGKTKLPIDRIAAFATALDIDHGRLMRLALNEYFPGMLASLEECLAPVVTDNERELLKVWRDATDGLDPKINPDQGENLKVGFMQFK